MGGVGSSIKQSDLIRRSNVFIFNIKKSPHLFRGAAIWSMMRVRFTHLKGEIIQERGIRFPKKCSSSSDWGYQMSAVPVRRSLSSMPPSCPEIFFINLVPDTSGGVIRKRILNSPTVSTSIFL